MFHVDGGKKITAYLSPIYSNTIFVIVATRIVEYRIDANSYVIEKDRVFQI
jgi:hypothetical protein